MSQIEGLNPEQARLMKGLAQLLSPSSSQPGAETPVSGSGASAAATLNPSYAVGLTRMPTPVESQVAHNAAAAYAHGASQLYGFDPIEPSGPNGCFSRPRTIQCGCAFNASSQTSVGALSHTMNAVGVAAVAFNVVIIVIWLNNSHNLVSWINKPDVLLQNYLLVPAIVGFFLLGAGHVLYIIGGSIIPSIFLLVVDMAGLAGSFTLSFAADNDTNRIVGLALILGALPFYHLILLVILLGREPTYVMPPPGGDVHGIPFTGAEQYPRMAGVPLVPGVAIGTTGAVAPNPFAGFGAEMVMTRGKGHHKKRRG